MKQMLLVVAVLLALGVTGVIAETPMGIHAAYVRGGDMDNDSFGAGAQLTGIESENASVELAWTWFQDDRGDTEADCHVIAITATYALPIPTTAEFYLGVGGGYYIVNASVKSDSDLSVSVDDEIGWHACGGVRLPMSLTTTLFSEYRHSEVSLDAKLKSGGAVIESSSVGFDHDMVRVGLDFTF